MLATARETQCGIKQLSLNDIARKPRPLNTYQERTPLIATAMPMTTTSKQQPAKSERTKSKKCFSHVATAAVKEEVLYTHETETPFRGWYSGGAGVVIIL